MKRIEREKKTIGLMVALYCRHKEKNAELCDACRDLLAYARRRLDSCRYGDGKCACKKCPTPCYTPVYRAKIREVMRFAGPRMLLNHPLAALRHLLGH